MATKRAKVLSAGNYQLSQAVISRESHLPERDALLLALSVRAGLRVGEIAKLKTSSLVDADGHILPIITVFGATSKSGRDREIPMHPELRVALKAFMRRYGEVEFVAISAVRRRGRLQQMTPNALAQWFRRLYLKMGFQGCSSHSGRRTFITEMARRANRFHNSLHDVQQLAGHRRLDTTQSYLAPSDDTFAMVASMGREDELSISWPFVSQPSDKFAERDNYAAIARSYDNSS